MEDIKIDFTRLVELLEREKGMILMLGARAGGFFRSQDFFNAMKMYSNPSFSRLSRAQQFGESYKLLINPNLLPPRKDVDRILMASLYDSGITDADTCLAKLVKQGIFDVIVSTNVDDLVERALENDGMRELRDFDIFSLHSSLSIRTQQFLSRRVIKFYGEL